MKKKILGIIMALSVTASVYASITVTPTKVEINANKIRNNYATSAIEVKGAQDRPMRYRAYTGYFKSKENSEVVFADGEKDEHNIQSKVRFVPSEFTIPPGRSQKVRVNIANLKMIPDGESRAIIYLEDVEQKEFNVPVSDGIGAQLVLKTRVAVPVYVDKGNFIRKADVETFDIVKEKDGLYTKVKVVSTGNSRVKYNGMIQVIQGKKLIDEYPLESKTVSGGSYFIAKQKIETEKIKEAGDYTLRMIFYYFDEKDNRKNIKKDAILRITGEI